MKETGIVRKLDNLGRLVIPKEIRRTMRIKEGTPIEFALLPSGEIVLNKYSLVEQISDYADDFCSVLGEIFDCVVLIGDRDKLISVYGISKKNYLGMKLSNEVLDVIDGKITYLAEQKEGTTIIPIIIDDKCTYKSELVYPITIQGEKEGVIILCGIDKDYNFDNSHLTCLKLVAKFLSIQLE